MIYSRYHYAQLELKHFESFKEKLGALVAYVEIDTVFCRLPEEQQLSDLSFDKNYNLIEILVPVGQPSYVKLYFQETLKLLEDSLDEYLQSEIENHYSINKTLEEAKELCIHLSKKNDVNKSLPYHENEIKFLTIEKNGKWFRLFTRQIKFEKQVQDELLDHFSIRKEFYQELVELISKKILVHMDLSTYPQKPYKWVSDNPHLEIAELLHALIQKRIQIKKDEKGSFAKLVKEFYNLFGLDDASFHQKLQIIRQRKQQSSWLQELPDFIGAIQKRSEIPKKES
jgi:hypothetical protein